ncbi:diguanylate cyclase (GGDEF)-like protein [Breoghania corrubedonensis]|uniref:Diguanylate cyclase (GGDEF)-like protein n=1 Tax=Breoghania corrubedonensis TaxID=665038 RepID=A0A2T5VDC5_9HYPH|nr:bifunctional diguanylate cyclase/phosphodiesterase [Breoghania corrubedonensis]PTW61736.1 diguanylate cyclase (GGDEF)-like protein [Breoghania corrubedonensis]
MRPHIRSLSALAMRPWTWFRARRHASFAFRFYTTLIPWIVAVNLMVAVAASVWGVREAERTVESVRDDAIQSLVFAIAKPVHDFEFDHVGSLLDDFPRGGSIEATWVTDDTGFVVAQAGRPYKAAIAGVMEVPIVHRKANSVVRVGTLHVAYSNRALWAVALWIGLHSLFLTLATTVVSLVITGRLAQKRVIAPLQHLAGAITRTRRDGTRHRVDLHTDGEFGTVIEGFNAMQARLDRDEQALLEINSRLRRAASEDSLTGLRNRAGFEEGACAVLLQARAARAGVVMLFIDLNRFKTINDTFGHAAGDEVLRTVGQRIAAFAPPGAITARLSGDEFVVMLTGDDVIERADALAGQLGREIGGDLVVDGHRLRPVGSIGFVATNDDYSLASLMIKADAAMYEMKKSLENQPAAYTAHVGRRSQTRISTERALSDGLLGDHFDIAVQPIVDLKTRAPVGGEVLLRLNHPVQGALSPASFIPVAEDCGLMPEIGHHVLARGVEALSALQGEPATAELYLSINVSSIQISQGFLARLETLLSAHDVDPRRVVIELTESMVLKADDGRGDIIRRIQDLGIRVALDDFGTGYSSFTYLKTLRPDIIKIDRSFVQAGGSAIEQGAGVGILHRLEALGDAVARVCGDLDLPMVGEGIESERDIDYCLRAGIRYGQGYLFARPMPLEEFIMWTGARVASGVGGVGGARLAAEERAG